MNDKPEVGYNYLDTRFSGTSSLALSGNEHFPILPEDSGTASTLTDTELNPILE